MSCPRSLSWPAGASGCPQRGTRAARRLTATLIGVVLGLFTAASAAQSVLIPLAGGPNALSSVPGMAVMPVQGSDRVDPQRHRGNNLEPVPFEQYIVSPLHPIRAQGRPAGRTIRFDGESRSLDFEMLIPDRSAVTGLRIATLSSINVLPERSQFRVFVNGTFVGEGQLDNFTSFETVEFPLRPAAVVEGRNDVRIELVQYHRIFCGPEASFALWTDIDLASSGAVIASDAVMSGANAFLMGLSAAAATNAGVEIRGTELLGDYAYAWVEEVTQMVSTVMGGDPIRFRVVPFYWSVADEVRSAARVTFVPAPANRISFRVAGDGAQVMVIEFIPNHPPSDLPEFNSILPRIGDPVQASLISTEEPVRFADFGFETTEVRDRYALIEQRFRLPDDYIVLTNAKAEINLDYAYAEGLPQGSMLLVHINDHNIRLLPLRGEGGQLIEQFPVRFEARYLQSGVNTLGFEVMVPGAPADLPCPVIDAPMLAIGSESTLTVPYSPSMYLPDMQMAFAGLTPASVTINDMSERAFDDDDVISLRAALSGGARRDAAALRPQLHLMSLDDLGSVPLGGYQLSRTALENVLFPDVAQLAAAAENPLAQHSLLRLRDNASSSAVVSRGIDWLKNASYTTLQWLHPRAGVLLEQWLRNQTGQAVLIQLDAARPNHLWLLRAPGADIGAISAAFVAARSEGVGPRGQVSVLGEDGQWSNWIAPDRQPLLLEPVRLHNIRHVVGNFVSAMPIRYVLGLFFLALVSALFALRLVIATRE